MKRFSSVVLGVILYAGVSRAEPAPAASSATPSNEPSAELAAPAPAPSATSDAAKPEVAASPSATPAPEKPAEAAPAEKPAPEAPAAAPVGTPAPAATATTVSAPAAPAPADVPPAPAKGPFQSRFEVGLNADVFWFTDKSYDLFSKNDLATSRGLNVGYAVLVDGPLSIVPELGFGQDDQMASNLFGGALQSTELETWRFYGGASARYAVLPFLEPEVRLTTGTSVVTATVTPGGGSAALVSDKMVSPFFAFGGGFSVHTKPGSLETSNGSLRSLVLGLSFEGGYSVAKSLELTPTPEHDPVRIHTTDAPLGSLARSAPYLRISGIARF
jgi:hypothetical protein